MSDDCGKRRERNTVTPTPGKENTPPAVGSACPHVPLSRRIRDWDPVIASLPLFSGLCPESREDLLRHARIRDFPKGKVLFLSGAPASRLYFVLKGWIKISKDTEDGREIVLQMLGTGDGVLESAVFLNSAFPFTAQVAEEATVLSISASGLRERMKQDNQLAGNFLTLMARVSRDLVREMEDTRLKTAEERIGLFLLRHFLDQGRGSRCIRLPYDKSLIAAQLNMRRETFSRVLGRMKRQGFRMEKHTVVMPGLRALCGFCDQDTADKCAVHGTSHCPHPHCAGDHDAGAPANIRKV